MIVRTFTHAWNMRVRIYAFDDVRLPVKNGLTVPQVLAGLAAAAVWVPLCLLLDIGSLVDNSGLVFLAYAAPPVMVMLNVDRPIANEKTAEEWLGSWLLRRGEPRRLAALGNTDPVRPVVLTAARWVPYDRRR